MNLSAFSEDNGREGGGGRAVVCFTSKTVANYILDPKNPRRGIVTESEIPEVVSVETLDYYWAKQANKEFGNIAYSESDDDFELVETVIARLRIGLPNVANTLAKFAANSDSDLVVKLPNGLHQLDDAAEIFFPNEKCIISTIARQTKHGEGILLEIDDRLYSRMNDYSKKVLMLHEALYSWALAYGAINSEGVRVVLAQLISKKPISFEILEVLKDKFMFDYREHYIYESETPRVYDPLFKKLVQESDKIILIPSKNLSKSVLVNAGFSSQAIDEISPSIQVGLQAIRFDKSIIYESFDEFLARNSTILSNFEGEYNQLKQQLKSLEDKYDDCKNFDCRIKIESEIKNIKEKISNHEWTAIGDFSNIFNFQYVWSKSNLRIKGQIVANYMCYKISSNSTPKSLIKQCNILEKDIKAWEEFRGDVLEKIDVLFFLEVNPLIQESLRNGELKFVLDDPKLGPIAENRTILYNKLSKLHARDFLNFVRNTDYFWTIKDFVIP